MKERPILFIAPMVRAILDGRKTQTRRIGKYQKDDATELGFDSIGHQTKGTVLQATYRAFPGRGTARWALCEFPYGMPGDRLWVKETFKVNEPPSGWIYRATDEVLIPHDTRPWKPSIFMPRAASRLTLEIVSVRTERLQAISEADAILEGIEAVGQCWRDYGPITNPSGSNQKVVLPRDSYRTLWESINGFGSWARNPWVWVIEFKRL